MSMVNKLVWETTMLFAALALKKYFPFFPLWTNIMGCFLYKNNTRISNSAVESYFNFVVDLFRMTSLSKYNYEYDYRLSTRS